MLCSGGNGSNDLYTCPELYVTLALARAGLGLLSWDHKRPNPQTPFRAHHYERG